MFPIGRKSKMEKESEEEPIYQKLTRKRIQPTLPKKRPSDYKNESKLNLEFELRKTLK